MISTGSGCVCVFDELTASIFVLKRSTEARISTNEMEAEAEASH